METIPIPGAEIYYDKNFLPAEEATSAERRSDACPFTALVAG